MIFLYILLAHLVGDYLLQSHWMATKKTEQWLPAISHGLAYTVWPTRSRTRCPC